MVYPQILRELALAACIMLPDIPSYMKFMFHINAHKIGYALYANFRRHPVFQYVRL